MKGVAVPRIMYGVKAIDVNGGGVKKWEVIQNRGGRLGLGHCSRFSPGGVVVGSLFLIHLLRLSMQGFLW